MINKQFLRFDNAAKRSCAALEAGENCRQIAHSQMLSRYFAKDAAEIGRHGQIAVFIKLFGREAGPFAQHVATVDFVADGKEARRVAMIGAAVAVLPRGASEFAHRQNRDIGHAVAQIEVKRFESRSELIQAPRQLALRTALIDVRVPAAALGERDFDADIGLNELRDLLQRIAQYEKARLKVL